MPVSVCLSSSESDAFFVRPDCSVCQIAQRAQSVRLCHLILPWSRRDATTHPRHPQSFLSPAAQLLNTSNLILVSAFGKNKRRPIKGNLRVGWFSQEQEAGAIGQEDKFKSIENFSTSGEESLSTLSSEQSSAEQSRCIRPELPSALP